MLTVIALFLASYRYSYQAADTALDNSDAVPVEEPLGAVYSYNEADMPTRAVDDADATAEGTAANSYDPIAGFGSLNRAYTSPPPPAVGSDPRAHFWTHRGSLRTNVIDGGATSPEGSPLHIKGVSCESCPCSFPPTRFPVSPCKSSVYLRRLRQGLVSSPSHARLAD